MKPSTISFVFSVAHLSNLTSAACKGVTDYPGGGAIAPLDVCLQQSVWYPWENFTALYYSSKLACEGDTGYQYYYGSFDCSGTPIKQDEKPLAICSGESCDYVVFREYYDTSDWDRGTCTEGGNNPYFDAGALIIDECVEVDNGSSIYNESAVYATVSCTSNSATFTTYADANCSGAVVNSTIQSNSDCWAVTTCGSAPTAIPSASPTAAEDVCKGVSEFPGGAAMWPLDVCLQNTNQEWWLNTTSYAGDSWKYACEGDTGYTYYYPSLDCSGTPMLREKIPWTICSGKSCDYAVTRNYFNSTDEYECHEGGINWWHVEGALIMNECVTIDNGSAEWNKSALYATYSCTSSSVSVKTYADANCSGAVVNSSTTSNSDCFEVTTCTTDDDGVSPVSVALIITLCAIGVVLGIGGVVLFVCLKKRKGKDSEQNLLTRQGSLNN